MSEIRIEKTVFTCLGHDVVQRQLMADISSFDGYTIRLLRLTFHDRDGGVTIFFCSQRVTDANRF